MDIRQFFEGFFNLQNELDSFFETPSTFFNHDQTLYKKPRDLMLKSRGQIEGSERRSQMLDPSGDSGVPFKGFFNQPQESSSFFSKSRVYRYSTDDKGFKEEIKIIDSDGNEKIITTESSNGLTKQKEIKKKGDNIIYQNEMVSDIDGDTNSLDKLSPNFSSPNDYKRSDGLGFVWKWFYGK